MKKNLENKYFILFLIIVIAIAIGIMTAMNLNKKEAEKTEEPKEVMHTMYVKINPLVKLTFKETFTKCGNDEYTCSEISSIIDYELVNNDAKDIYNDLNFKGKDIYDALAMLCDTARDNEVAFKDLEITSDYELKLPEEEILNKINENSNYEYNFSVFVDFKEHINDKEVVEDYETTVEKYAVIFDTDGGSNVSSIKIEGNNIINKPNDPTKSGYRFIEWQLDGKTFDFNTKITKDITLKAVWEKIITYTVTFDTNGGSNIKSIVVEKNNTINKPSNPIKEGYDFVEWQLNGKKFSFNTKITKDITLKAVWKKFDPTVKKYTVTFNVDGGSSIENEIIEENNVINKPNNPTKEGYKFIEWQLDGKPFDFNTKITKDITLKANWKKIIFYTVTFDTDGGNNISSLKIEENNTISKPGNPTKEGYRFIGWQLDEKLFDFNTKIIKDITLKAIWEKIVTYTVTFDADGGSNVDKIVVEENNTINKPNNPTKDGYDFIEWQLDGKTFSFKTKITRDITLKAMWKKSITSTMEKINLNENILIYKSGSTTKGCGSDVVFTDNIEEVMADYKSYDGYDRYSNSKFQINYDDYATDEERWEAEQKMYEALDKDFNEKKSMLVYNSDNVNKAHNDLENYFKTIKGLKNYSVNNNSKSFVVEYEYIYISNAESLGNFGKSFNQYYSNIDNKINNVINQYGGKTLWYGGCGSGGPGEPPILLTEEICSEYNLNCDRW